MRLPDTALLRLAMLAAVIVPVAMLVLSYVMICLTLSHPAPFLLPAHEDGVRTLLNTILYFEHATRELPLDILLGLVIGGAATFALTPADRINRPGLSRCGLLLITLPSLTDRTAQNEQTRAASALSLLATALLADLAGYWCAQADLLSALSLAARSRQGDRSSGASGGRLTPRHYAPEY